MFAGAGVPAGALIGASDKWAAHPRRDPFTPEDITATIYRILGIPDDTEIRDPLQRPQRLITGQAIRGLRPV